MGRPVWDCACALMLWLVAAAAATAADQSAAAHDAAMAMGRGEFPAAEAMLRAEVAAHADDAWALSLLGVALDNQKKIPEAEEFHARAVALLPRSPEILNNYGTHLWAAGQYKKAETWFARAVAAAPGYFNALFNLGVMAAFAGHYDRAHEVLEAAVRQQPGNVNVLYRLAAVEEATRQWEPAVMHLAQAQKLDPQRADIQKLLAVTTTELGALDDAAAAWERYLKLEPNDDAARRERGYVAARTGKLEEGTADLEWYVSRHPDDPVGHYEIAQAQRSSDVAQAMAHLDKAVSLDPEYLPARAARGSLSYQQGKPEAALADLELVAAKQPENAANLDRLGQGYQALDRAADAVRVLRRAVELAPDNSTTVLHLGRALADAGQTEESKAVMTRFKQLGPEQNKGVPAGLVEFLSLPAEGRRADYRARAEKAVHDHPDDPVVEVEYLKMMVQDRNMAQVTATARRLAGLKPKAGVLADAGHALLASEYWAQAKDLLQQAGEATLDLAAATFHVNGPVAGLAVLERMPEPARNAEYHLAHAQMLDAAGKTADADAALAEARQVAPGQPQVYRQAVALLVKQGRAADALRWIEEAAAAFPDDREVLLLEATTYELAKRSADAERLLTDIQNRWPEWPAVWMAHGIILATHQRAAEAKQAVEIAITLGAPAAEAQGFLKPDAATLARLFQGTLFHAPR